MTANEKRIYILYDELVPRFGKAESLAGELIRAVAIIEYCYHVEGDKAGIGHGEETCNLAARFLIARGTEEIGTLVQSFGNADSEGAYEKLLDILEGMVAGYVENTPELQNIPTEGIWEFCEKEDAKKRNNLHNFCPK